MVRPYEPSLFKVFFLIWTIFKVFVELITILLLLYVSVFWPRGRWDLKSPIRDRTCTPYAGKVLTIGSPGSPQLQ